VILTLTVSRVILFCRTDRKTLAFIRAAACAVLVSAFPSPLHAANTIVRMETTMGIIDVELYDDQAPITVANFLRYAGRGDYTYNGFIHRHATINSSGVSVIQGGGYTFDINPFTGQPVFSHIAVDQPILNEFSPSRSNVRGSIAMAKLGNQPDSATSEWFFNLANNSAALDNTDNSGGFAVFGQVHAGMDVLDNIASLAIQPLSLPMSNGATQLFNELPVINYDSSAGLQRNNLVMVTRIPNVKSTHTDLGILVTFTTDVNMVFDHVRTVAADTALTWLTSFTSPPNQSAHFNNGMFTLKMSGAMDANGHNVTLYDGATNRPTHYYAYGKTLDNPADHWYDFMFDGVTGAEIKSDRIILHFVDGMRGDDDLTVNDSIAHTGVQAVVTAVDDGSAQDGGCSIVEIPPDMTRSGDWIVVALFLTMLALVRKRARHQVQRGYVTNIASP
jgi:cyclophilin family peptidyl-prolyl cis-trans isomerase